MRMEKGITLVEVLTTLGIATVVGTLLLVIMVNTGGLFIKQSSKVAGGLSANDAISRIQKSIRQASSVDQTASGEKLVLKVPATDPSGSSIANTFDVFEILKDEENLVFKILPDAQSSRSGVNQILATDLDMLKFEYFDSQIPPQQINPAQAVKIKTTLALEQNIATAEANLRND